MKFDSSNGTLTEQQAALGAVPLSRKKHSVNDPFFQVKHTTCSELVLKAGAEISVFINFIPTKLNKRSNTQEFEEKKQFFLVNKYKKEKKKISLVSFKHMFYFIDK